MARIDFLAHPPLSPLAATALWLVAACTPTPHDAPEARAPSPLASVQSWAIQLQGLDRDGARAALVAASCDMLVIEPTRTVAGLDAFPIRDIVAEIRASHGRTRARKLCLAYVNVGQAEDYRTYWQPSWRAPTKAAAGEPAFVLSLDPDGWPGNYPVAYWEPQWRSIATELIEAAARDGFDGAYLDWVLGYQEPAVIAAAQFADVEPARAMVDLLLHLRARARALRPDFVLIAQNAAGLVSRDPRFVCAVDAVSQEDLSFRGEAGAGWDDVGAGDLATSAEDAQVIATQLAECRARGLCVFTLDYARDPANVRRALARSRALGCVPCVSRVALDRLAVEMSLPATPR